MFDPTCFATGFEQLILELDYQWFISFSMVPRDCRARRCRSLVRCWRRCSCSFGFCGCLKVDGCFGLERFGWSTQHVTHSLRSKNSDRLNQVWMVSVVFILPVMVDKFDSKAGFLNFSWEFRFQNLSLCMKKQVYLSFEAQHIFLNRWEQQSYQRMFPASSYSLQLLIMVSNYSVSGNASSRSDFAGAGNSIRPQSIAFRSVIASEKSGCCMGSWDAAGAVLACVGWWCWSDEGRVHHSLGYSSLAGSLSSTVSSRCLMSWSVAWMPWLAWLSGLKSSCRALCSLYVVDEPVCLAASHAKWSIAKTNFYCSICLAYLCEMIDYDYC